MQKILVGYKAEASDHRRAVQQLRKAGYEVVELFIYDLDEHATAKLNAHAPDVFLIDPIGYDAAGLKKLAKKCQLVRLDRKDVDKPKLLQLVKKAIAAKEKASTPPPAPKAKAKAKAKPKVKAKKK